MKLFAQILIQIIMLVFAMTYLCVDELGAAASWTAAVMITFYIDCSTK